MITKRRVLLIVLSAVVLSIAAITTYVLLKQQVEPEDKEQVGFIRDFVNNIGESKNGKWLAVDKLYDKSLFEGISAYTWNFSHRIELKNAHKIQDTKERNITECLDFLAKSYRLNEIEAYDVVIKKYKYSENSSKGDIVENIEDIFYITKNDGKYYLLYTEELFDKLNNGGVKK